jgi:hypothetical protein
VVNFQLHTNYQLTRDLEGSSHKCTWFPFFIPYPCCSMLELSHNMSLMQRRAALKTQAESLQLRISQTASAWRARESRKKCCVGFDQVTIHYHARALQPISEGCPAPLNGRIGSPPFLAVDQWMESEETSVDMFETRQSIGRVGIPPGTTHRLRHHVRQRLLMRSAVSRDEIDAHIAEFKKVLQQEMTKRNEAPPPPPLKPWPDGDSPEKQRRCLAMEKCKE